MFKCPRFSASSGDWAAPVSRHRSEIRESAAARRDFIRAARKIATSVGGDLSLDDEPISHPRSFVVVHRPRMVRPGRQPPRAHPGDPARTAVTRLGERGERSAPESWLQRSDAVKIPPLSQLGRGLLCSRSGGSGEKEHSATAVESRRSGLRRRLNRPWQDVRVACTPGASGPAMMNPRCEEITTR